MSADLLQRPTAALAAALPFAGASAGAGDGGAAAQQRARNRRARLVLLLLGLAVLAVIAAYLTVGVRAGWDFVLPFRGRRVAAMAIVGVAVSTSTVAFQTLAANRILTPSILGFDALYQGVATLLVFVLGATGFITLGVMGRFWVALPVMLVASLALFHGLFTRGRRSLHIVLLVGIVVGSILRALTLMLQRILDPDTFQVLQARLFASFAGVNPQLLTWGGIVVGAAAITLWSLHRRLDVMALGRETAIMLGVDHRRTTAVVITLVAVLVSTSTALVGPITFFGLLVANLAYALVRDHRHAVVLPAAALLSVGVLVGGQTILEYLLGMSTVLSVVIEFLGGIVFIAMLIASGRRR